MKYVRRAVYALLAGVLVNYLALITVPLSRAAMGAAAAWLGGLLALAGFVYINLCPLPKTAPTKRIRYLAEGCELLWLFAVSFALTLCVQPVWLWWVFAGSGSRDGAVFVVRLDLQIGRASCRERVY